MHIIIGGVEREVSQVATFAEYHGGIDGNSKLNSMSASDIFYGARAERLSKKILQIAMDREAISLSRGKNFINIPKIVYKNIESFDGGSNLEKAINAEEYYAKQAAEISSGKIEWRGYIS